MKQYIIDAFTNEVFKGNQAAIVILEEWIDDALMQNIAKENKFSETAFIVKEDYYHLRWFTPGGEIDFCGHATLAASYVLFNYYNEKETITFKTMSGLFEVKRKDQLYEMNFPSYPLEKVEVTEKMIQVLGATPKEAYKARDLLCIFDDEDIIKNMKPDFNKMKELEGLLVHVSAPSKEYDCISRSFAPKLDVEEDPVCGSGHCHIVPYWANKLNKNEITAYQASERTGILYCNYLGERMTMSGECALYSIGEIL